MIQIAASLRSVRRLSLLAGLATLAGCATPPSYDPAAHAAPAALAPSNWQAPLPHGGRLDTLANWWQQFNDPALQQLITSAQDASATIASARARIETSRAALVLANAQLSPTLNASAGVARSRAVVNMPASTSITAGLQSSWELDLFGGNRASRDAADARAQGGIASWHDARVSIAAEVAQQYTALRACQAQVEQTRQDALSRRETARLTDLAARAGFQAPANAALTRASAAQGNSLLVQQTAQCELLVKALVALTGLEEPALRERLREGQARLPQPAQITVPALPAQVLAQRPDLAAAERELVASSLDIGSVQAQFYPRVTLAGSIGAAHFSSGGNSTDGVTWSLGPLSVALPLLDGGVRRANFDAAYARADEARSLYASKLRGAVREVEEALVNLQSTAERATDAQTATDGFAASYTAAQARYRGGLSNLFELEDARRSAVQAQSALIELQRERVAAWISLYRALGGGWSATDSAPPTAIAIKPAS